MFKGNNITLVIYLFFSSLFSYSQIEIKGSVTDFETKEFISFASVFLKHNALGTATNDKGEYSLKITSGLYAQDTLIVRCMGYTEKRIPILLHVQSKTLDISLQQDYTMLPLVEVTSSKKTKNEAREILKKVRKSISKNYITSTTFYEGFYRESLLENEIVTKLNEASFQLRYSGYPESKLSKKTFNNYWDDYYESSKYKPKPVLSYFAQNWPVFIDDENEVNIIESRVSANRSYMDGTGILGDPLGGPADLIGMDNLKYQLHFFDKKLESEYAFGLSEDEFLNDTISCFVIIFKPVQPSLCYIHDWSKKVAFPAFEGKIYVNKSNYSVEQIQCKSVNWSGITNMCQKEQNVNRDFFVPEAIEYTVSYQNTQQGKVLKSVKYKSHHKTNAGVFSWEREVLLSAPIKTTLSFPEEKKFPVISESLRYRTTSYNEQYWQLFEKTDNYIKLPEKYRDDMEKELPLPNQYELLNQSVQLIPVPRIDTNLYNNVSHIDKGSVINDLKKFNEYSSAVLQKLVVDEKKFTHQARQVIELKEPSSNLNNTQRAKYKIDSDSLFQYHYFELQQDSSYKPIFNITTENKLDYSKEISEIDFTEHFIIYTTQAKDNFRKILKIKQKSNPFLLDSIPNVSSYNIINDSLLLYTITSNTGRSYQVRLHKIGSADNDKILISENNVNYEVELENSASKSYTLINVTSKDNNKLWVFDKSKQLLYYLPSFDTTLLKVADHFSGSDFYIVEGGKKLYKATLKNKAFTTELLYTSNEIINDFYLVKNKLVIAEYYLFDMHIKAIDLLKHNEVTLVKIKKDYNYIELLKPDNINGKLYITVESINHPVMTYSFDPGNNQLSLIEEDKYSFWASSGNYISEVIYAKSTDGTDVPILITYNKDAIKDSITAVLFETYGAYGTLDYSMFEPENIVLLKNGFILAKVGVRGSGILGVDWYNDGKKNKKKNSFNDFISCVRHIKLKYGLPSNRVFAKGVSAGGMIMAYMVNNYSDEFGGIILDRPFLDVYNLMIDSSNYLTTLEYTEWGNPEVKNNKEYIYSYSPAQNIPQKVKCNIFMRGSYLDYITPISQIALCSFKYSSRMDDNKLNLFKTDFNTGHLIPFNYKRLAEEYTFMKYCIINK